MTEEFEVATRLSGTSDATGGLARTDEEEDEDEAEEHEAEEDETERVDVELSEAMTGLGKGKEVGDVVRVELLVDEEAVQETETAGARDSRPKSQATSRTGIAISCRCPVSGTEFS